MKTFPLFTVFTRETHPSSRSENSECLLNKNKHHQGGRPGHCPSAGAPRRHGKHPHWHSLLYEP